LLGIGNLKLEVYNIRKLFRNFYNHVLKLSLIMYIPGFLIVLAVTPWRTKVIYYILVYIACFCVSLFIFTRKREVINEFKENQ